MGLVVTRGQVVVFAHRTFPEYLTAAFLAGQQNPAAALGQERLLDPAWAEVTALVAGELASGSPRGHQVRAYLEGLLGTAREPDAWAPVVGAVAACLPDLEAWNLPESATAPVREALATILPALDQRAKPTKLYLKGDDR